MAPAEAKGQAMKLAVLLNKFPFNIHDGGALVSKGLARAVLDCYPNSLILVPHTFKHPFNYDHIPPHWHPQQWKAVECHTRVTLKGFISAIMEGRAYHLIRYQRSPAVSHLVTLVKNYGPQTIILDGMAGLAFLPIIRKAFPDMPIIYHAHNVEWKVWQTLCHQTKGQPVRRGALEVLYRLLRREEINTLPLATVVTGVSPVDVQYFSGISGVKTVSFLPAALWDKTPDPVPWPADENTLKLYHVGSMDWQPTRQGIELFLDRYWPYLRKKFPEIELHLAGNHMPDTLHKRKLPGLFVHGFVDSVADFIRDKHICIVPVFAGSGIKVKVIEALALGRPVITTPLGAEGLPLIPDVHVLLASSPEEFEKQLAYLQSQRNLAVEIAQKGHQVIAKTYHLANTCQKLREILKQASEIQ
ncbi:MAG: glycosyltransferase family 4 protein [Flavobacteriales bacterium]|nr:glycosyltransferase family 4 protein [Flavobacteriales bacterium]MCX7768506.1 glycosyltransferase family 4 protein [Flavobacteriales bacterium]MDW8409838.1 glycosyltransferase [Flavobacteriales bacterium]